MTVAPTMPRVARALETEVMTFQRAIVSILQQMSPAPSTRTIAQQMSPAPSTRTIPQQMSPAPSPRLFQFFSRSKDVADLPGAPRNWRKVLSNFYAAPLLFRGRTYPTPEHVFHAMKALTSTQPGMQQLFHHVEDGSLAPCGALAADAKRMGSKKAYTHHGAKLDVPGWNNTRDAVQWEITQARIEQHPVYRSILEALVRSGGRLLHFDRTGARSYWGGKLLDATTGEIAGKNRLGVLTTDAAYKHFHQEGGHGQRS